MNDVKEILQFIAIVPSNTDFTKENFVDVRLPNPEDVAQLIVKELSKSSEITVASFGPRTVTSHNYLVGRVSVLDSLLHSFGDAKIEVKLIIRNSTKKQPFGQNTYYSIKTATHVDELSKKIEALPESDYIKVIMRIQKYTIILLSLPPFFPFNGKGSMVFQTNGWNVLMNPKNLIHTRAFALLHFDQNLPTESAVMKFLPNEPREVEVTEDDMEPFEEPVSVDDDEAYEYEYSEDESAPGKGAGKRAADRKDASKINNLRDKSRNAADERNKDQDYGRGKGKDENADKDMDSFSSRQSRSTRQSGKSTDKYSIHEVTVPKQRRGSAYGDNDENDSQASQNWKQNRPSDRYNENENDNDNDNYNENEEDINESPSQQKGAKGRRKTRTRRVIKKKRVPKQTIDVQQLLNQDDKSRADSESSIPTEANVNFDEEEEPSEDENSIEVQIQQFVSNLQLNVPVLTDTSVFSTLFQQLFYERWKSGILQKCRTDLGILRDTIKQRSTDEIAALKQLVDSQDLTIFAQREEQRMRLLEAKTIETIQQVMEKRLSQYANVAQKSLLNKLQIQCGDYVTLQKQIRDRRADIRSITMELRVAQSDRMEKLKDFHDKVEEIQKAASAQTRLDNAMAELQKINQEKAKLEADKETLLKQKSRVKSLLDGKKGVKVTTSKRK